MVRKNRQNSSDGNSCKIWIKLGRYRTLITPANISQHTLIVGLTNPILGYDGMGWRIAEKVSKQSGMLQ
ncbi:hypothetical protein H206_02933 [Candidatus Electrothrix aarhusensis]|uniref:Uncharacterized protein n=1 Tax=Candidatus Electrothrix aarhusensis TaxID=1859131 RepID=A0A3S3QNS8_9BACT|nr:hypothetical protein H206_02933 [Candidatus Electrothrix aarhusensis]